MMDVLLIVLVRHVMSVARVMDGFHHGPMDLVLHFVVIILREDINNVMMEI